MLATVACIHLLITDMRYWQHEVPALAVLFFWQLYSVPEEDDDLFRNFDFLSPTTLLLAQFRGQVAVLDTRTPG